MKYKKWRKKDSSSKWTKINLRRKFLPKNAKVLDLFCGSGEMYQYVYKDNASSYLGIDKNKVHNNSICIKTNNLFYVSGNDISGYDVFDLDDWGSPWKLFYLILKKWQGEKATFFMTDGLVLKSKISGNITKWVSATEQVPCKMNIPGLSRWYIDIFSTMLLNIQKRYNLNIDKVIYIFNERKTVCYWAIKISRS